MKECYRISKEATIPLSTYSHSAFGVGFTVFSSSEEGGRCFCASYLSGGSEPESCRDFRKGLTAEAAPALQRCPSGLGIIAVPVREAGDEKVLLVSDGFLGEEDTVPEALKGDVESGIVRLPPGQADLLFQLMEQTASLLSTLCSGMRESSGLTDREDIWRSEGARALIGVSPAMTKIRDTLATYANSDEPVLIESEQGNGRHLVASLIHRLAPGKTGPFIAENLSLLPEIMQDRELFGLKGGGSPGLVERATGGTLFLNGLEKLTAQAQKNLLQHITAPRGRKRGADSSGKNGVKIVAATSRSMGDMIRKGRFRSDLHRKLSRLTIFLPPLRERREDIPLLTDYFLRKLGRNNGSSIPRIEKESLLALQEYTWPGNIRELEAETERAAAYGGEVIDLEDFSPPVQHAAHPPRASLTNLREAVGSLEIDMITQTLAETNWNKSQAARILGLSRLGLQKKIDRFGLDRRR